MGPDHSALTIAPAAGFSIDRALATTSSVNTSTVCRHVRASTDPGSGAVSDQPPAPSSSTRNRNMACRSRMACSTTNTSPSVTPTGAWINTVWLN